jgi:DNA damage-inducible protein 1
LGRSTNQLGIPDAILHDPSRVRDFIRSTPALLFSIESQNPSLYRALMNADSIAPFAEMWRIIVSRMEADRAAETERLRLATADPMDPAVQARIEEEIRLKNVQENYEMAMEYNPEVSSLLRAGRQAGGEGVDAGASHAV